MEHTNIVSTSATHNCLNARLPPPALAISLRSLPPPPGPSCSMLRCVPCSRPPSAAWPLPNRSATRPSVLLHTACASERNWRKRCLVNGVCVLLDNQIAGWAQLLMPSCQILAMTKSSLSASSPGCSCLPPEIGTVYGLPHSDQGPAINHPSSITGPSSPLLHVPADVPSSHHFITREHPFGMHADQGDCSAPRKAPEGQHCDGGPRDRQSAVRWGATTGGPPTRALACSGRNQGKAGNTAGGMASPEF